MDLSRSLPLRCDQCWELLKDEYNTQPVFYKLIAHAKVHARQSGHPDVRLSLLRCFKINPQLAALLTGEKESGILVAAPSPSIATPPNNLATSAVFVAGAFLNGGGLKKSSENFNVSVSQSLSQSFPIVGNEGERLNNAELVSPFVEEPQSAKENRNADENLAADVLNNVKKTTPAPVTNEKKFPILHPTPCPEGMGSDPENSILNISVPSFLISDLESSSKRPVSRPDQVPQVKTEPILPDPKKFISRKEPQIRPKTEDFKSPKELLKPKRERDSKPYKRIRKIRDIVVPDKLIQIREVIPPLPKEDNIYWEHLHNFCRTLPRFDSKSVCKYEGCGKEIANGGSKEVADVHLMQHFKKDIYVCAYCDRTYYNRMGAFLHMKNSHLGHGKFVFSQHFLDNHDKYQEELLAIAQACFPIPDDAVPMRRGTVASEFSRRPQKLTTELARVKDVFWTYDKKLVCRWPKCNWILDSNFFDICKVEIHGMMHANLEGSWKCSACPGAPLQRNRGVHIKRYHEKDEEEPIMTDVRSQFQEEIVKTLNLAFN